MLLPIGDMGYSFDQGSLKDLATRDKPLAYNAYFNTRFSLLI